MSPSSMQPLNRPPHRLPLIQVDELSRLLHSPERPPVVLDVRFRMDRSTGRQEFEQAHIPGASYVDLETELAAIRPDGAGGRHPMPTVESFTVAMRSAGVTLSRPVVAYDGWASLPASRLWWMLRHLGFQEVRVLDGGIGAWTAAGQPTESGPGSPVAGDFRPAGTGVGTVLNATDAARYAATHLLLDARPADRFRGENETIDPVAGHIPGAISAPALATVDGDGRFLPAEELSRRFRELGAKEGKPVGTYCGSGIQATHLALALSVASITDSADVYIGSWSDWITSPDKPIALG